MYHINNNGDVKECTARKKPCPFPGNPHNESKEKLQEVAEQSMEKKHSEKPLTKKSADSDNIYASMPLSELNKVAKDTADARALEQCIARGSQTTLNTLVTKNPHLTAEHLVTLRHTMTDEKKAQQALLDPSYPVSEMSASDMQYVVDHSHKDRLGRSGASVRKELLHNIVSSDSITDAHVEHFASKAQSNRKYDDIARSMLAQPGNKVSKEKVNAMISDEYAQDTHVSSARGPSALSEMMPSQKVDTSIIHKHHHNPALYVNSAHKSVSTENMSDFATYAVKNENALSPSYAETTGNLSSAVNSNPHTSTTDVIRVAYNNSAPSSSYLRLQHEEKRLSSLSAPSEYEKRMLERTTRARQELVAVNGAEFFEHIGASFTDQFHRRLSGKG